MTLFQMKQAILSTSLVQVSEEHGIKIILSEMNFPVTPMNQPFGLLFDDNFAYKTGSLFLITACDSFALVLPAPLTCHPPLCNDITDIWIEIIKIFLAIFL